jgi:hypothetical protein
MPVTSTGFGENVFVCVYSRHKRFEIMLKALLYPCFDPKDTVMLTHLFKKERYKTIQEMILAMKLCKTKEKRFHSLHLFSALLCDDYMKLQPPTMCVFRRLMVLFDEVLCRFNATANSKFFSYPWLIRTLLNRTGETRYDKYIKRIRCKKRNEYYKELFTDLVKHAPKTYRMRECGTSKCG